MSKTIDFSKSIYEICREYPEVLDIMKGLGFENINNPAMLNTAGRVMTIPKGAVMKKISIESVEKAFKERGYEVIR